MGGGPGLALSCNLDKCRGRGIVCSGTGLSGLASWHLLLPTFLAGVPGWSIPSFALVTLHDWRPDCDSGLCHGKPSPLLPRKYQHDQQIRAHRTERWSLGHPWPPPWGKTSNSSNRFEGFSQPTTTKAKKKKKWCIKNPPAPPPPPPPPTKFSFDTDPLKRKKASTCGTESLSCELCCQRQSRELLN